MCRCIDVHINDNVQFRFLGLPLLRVYFTENNNWEYAVVMFHSKYDLADAYEIYPRIWPEPYKHKTFYVAVKKRIRRAISTNQHPCSKEPRRTCQEKVFYQSISEKYRCQLNVALDGIHLQSAIKVSN